MKPLTLLSLLLALFVGISVAGTSTVTTITLVSKDGVTMVISTTPAPDGTAPGFSVVTTLPDGTVLRGAGKGSVGPDGSWYCQLPLKPDAPDGDGSGILPDRKDYQAKVHADPSQDDGNPDQEGGELNFKSSTQLGRGSIPLYY